MNALDTTFVFTCLAELGRLSCLDSAGSRLGDDLKMTSSLWPKAYFTVAWGIAPGTKGFNLVWPKAKFTMAI